MKAAIEATILPHMPGPDPMVTVSDRDFRHGNVRVYREFFVAIDPATGPGWYVWGRCRTEYGPRGIIRLCARPSVAPRAHPHYNVRVQRGWHLKRDAQAVADELNRRFPAPQPEKEQDHAPSAHH